MPALQDLINDKIEENRFTNDNFSSLKSLDDFKKEKNKVTEYITANIKPTAQTFWKPIPFDYKHFNALKSMDFK